jgi:SAM-dependent methyltransferase
MRFPEYETRTLDELKQHYLVEKQLASRFSTASAAERRWLYFEAYAELLERVPLHPHHTRKADARQSEEETNDKLRFLARFLGPRVNFLEIGAGNCSLSTAVAKYVKRVYALEVSEAVVRSVRPAKNLEVVISDGCSVPVPDGSIDVAYSYQVMEHVHPDDAAQQLQNIYRALAPGGVYICITPNRVSGPHDISQYFEPVATGLHLREYTWGELQRVFLSAGFLRVDAYVGFRNRYFRLPMWVLRCLERSVSVLPYRLRREVTNLRGMRNLLFITAAAVKQSTTVRKP